MVPTVTLQDLVAVVSECADSEAEVVATVVHMVKSGLVRLKAGSGGSKAYAASSTDASLASA